ncbi:constitutive coactivator of peroxisome proliferator-activated receptor gamma isoform X2 [Ixodes scapularis]
MQGMYYCQPHREILSGAAMGVRGMESFLESVVPGGCTQVNIVEEAGKHRSKCPPGTRPTIVVDGLSLISWIYSHTRDHIFGGPWRDLVQIIMGNFVEMFEGHNIGLVFFFDGCVSSTKVEEWRIRRQQRLVEIQKTFGRLYAGQWTGNMRDDYSCPSGTGYTLCFAVKHLTSCKVFRSVEECDLEVARYAEQHGECFALLSQDTDFAIFNTRVLYLSTKHLDTKTLTTCAYHGETLAQHLGLERKLLPLFACLAGNDIVSRYDHLRHFHSSLGCKGRRAAHSCFPEVASVIREERWTDQPDNTVAARTGVSLRLLQEAVASYSLRVGPSYLAVPPDVDPQSWHLVVEKYRQSLTFPGLLQVLYTRELFLRECMEEILGPNVPPGYSCFRSVRRKAYWVLFGGKSHVVVMEHVAYPGNIGVLSEPVACTPISLSGNVPPLWQLWSGEPSLQEVRWQLFYGSLGLHFTLEDLRALPARYIVLCATLHLMFLANVLTNQELSALLLQAILLSEDKCERRSFPIPYSEINPRLVSLSCYFMEGVQFVVMSLSACGSPFPLADTMPWLYFDGKLFHSIHRQLYPTSTASSILEHNRPLVELYEYLWNVVTTRNRW